MATGGVASRGAARPRVWVGHSSGVVASRSGGRLHPSSSPQTESIPRHQITDATVPTLLTGRRRLARRNAGNIRRVARTAKRIYARLHVCTSPRPPTEWIDGWPGWRVPEDCWVMSPDRHVLPIGRDRRVAPLRTTDTGMYRRCGEGGRRRRAALSAMLIGWTAACQSVLVGGACHPHLRIK